ncbi:hypothetical protein [Catalinimonas niigatensis]|uniref:hypothetical protein n=1 Tax=Catalinimonas niigatensis TaxID=1397264 RepID=UPI002666AD95|nr:hypothetical protein [Catalinimonas niigatensis]WPP52820.1 hypothetical protein PZB72_10570 [Catalinimonas niigatensis]
MKTFDYFVGNSFRMKESEQTYILKCRQGIEKRLGWGSAEQWVNQDFICLSELIFQETGTNLSTTTLKRIWGKVKYESVPQTTTLNVLAQFAGYSDWRVLKTQCSSEEEKQKAVAADSIQNSKQDIALKKSRSLSDQTYRQDKKVIMRSFMIMLLLLVGGSALFGLMFSMQAKEKVRSSLATQDFSFVAYPVTTGLPNTVIFDYNASAAPTDRIYIQPSGDPKQRVEVSKQEHRHTSMFYYPGAYQAKLMVDKEVVRQQEFLIRTNGWLALVEREPIPHYFEENIISMGTLGLSQPALESTQLDLQNDTPWVAYYNVGEFGEVYSDNFMLETEVKSTFSEGKAVCQDSSVVILYDNAPPLTIPLAISGCLANLDTILKGQGMKTEDINLLAFGADFSDWIQVSCEAKEQQLSLHINRQLAYQGPLPQKSSRIVGIAYRFHGTGLVNYVSLSQPDGQEVYYEDFQDKNLL